MSSLWPRQNRRLLVTLVLLTALVFATPNHSFAASSIGGKCSKVNSFQIINKKVAICLKKGNLLVWSLANTAQKNNYKILQTQLLVSSREKNLTNLRTLKDKYSSISNVVPVWNDTLIQTKKALIDGMRSQLFSLEDQKEDQEQIKKNAQNDLQIINNSISTTQSNFNSLQNQINTQQNVVNNAKVYHDSAYNSYVSVKAQSDYLSYSYQSALSSNSAMLTAKVLCDFGFGSCGIYSSAQYSYNASIISQYNSASARTSSAYASYSNYYNQYSSSLSTLTALKNQQVQYTNNLNSLNSQKNQISQTISTSESKIANLIPQIAQAVVKFTPFEAAENRIESDLKIYLDTKNLLEVKCAELVVAIDEFLLLANQEFIEKTSASTWDAKYLAMLGLQKDIDLKTSVISLLLSSLDSYLNTL
jgi:chromosome segregation ATPase